MQQIAEYDSDISDTATTVPDSISTLEDTQIVEFEPEIEPTQIVEDEPEMTSAQLRYTQPVTAAVPIDAPALAAPINAEIDYLPPREGRRFIAQIPEPTAPKGVRGWSPLMLEEAIHRCNLPGGWRQGGQINRGVFEGVSEQGHFIINWHAGTWWCQGKAARQVHMQLIAAEAARLNGAGGA